METRNRELSDNEMEVLFRTWWQQSYPTPPGVHAINTHIGWGQFLLQELGINQQQKEQPR